MFSWVGLILQVLKLVNWLIEEGQKHKWINEGELRQIAKAQAEQIRKNEYAKKTLAESERLSDAELDASLRDLAGGGDSK